MAHLRTFMILFGTAFVLYSMATIVRFYARPTNIWWTPPAFATTLAGASDHARVLLRGVPLEDEVRAGRVALVVGGQATPVTDADLRVRLNNDDRLRVGLLPSLIAAGVSLGAAGMLLLFGLLGWAPPRRPESEEFARAAPNRPPASG
jgi:hypothetical protein